MEDCFAYRVAGCLVDAGWCRDELFDVVDISPLLMRQTGVVDDLDVVARAGCVIRRSLIDALGTEQDLCP
ncbi:hypothetical protein [Cohaesibacter celericrescens]|uniref:Uncharacterized protein n=1 Tax=Cohaesibacter celericrescens TaxID=2067669 RepID=A0A2N5XSW1_9HYPH|nr:hypothetical protein [Cohaesibacter celericrescens]PLW77537.1 hypothetical protein C0081_09490 [Cohaesibacter celericrescens]